MLDGGGRRVQPALLYLVPCILAPLLLRARKLHHTALLWEGFDDDGGGGGASGDASGGASPFSTGGGLLDGDLYVQEPKRNE
jgi:hypothetical protein